MSFFSIIIDFFNSIFRSSSPEVQRKQALKKIETEIKSVQPPIYKTGFLLPAIGEVFFILFKNTKIINEILTSTLFSEDLQRNDKYSDFLVSTGFSTELRGILNSLSLEERLKDALEDSSGKNNWEVEQRKKLDKLQKSLRDANFQQIERVINGLEQLYDICRFNYLSAIHQFNRGFVPDSSDDMPNFETIPEASLEDVFMDLYYLTANFEITTSVARAIIALKEHKTNAILLEEETNQIMTALKKISSSLKKVLSPEIMKKLLILIKKDPNLTIPTGTYNHKPVQKYAERLKETFTVDEQRIRTKKQDNEIAREVQSLFGSRPLIEVLGYNNELNRMLQADNIQPLLLVSPVQILKTFLTYYYTDSIVSFFNGIVIEGFFTNESYKSAFSSTVFAATEAKIKIHDFEGCFAKDGELDLALIKSYIKERRQNPDLLKKIVQMVETANRKAKELLEEVVPAIAELTQIIDALFIDVKKAKPEFISNLKILFISSRNRDNVDSLEKDFFEWKNLLEIMRNYVIIKKE